MKLYVPFTRLSEATEVFLATYGCIPPEVEVVPVEVTGNPWGYLEHLQSRWDEGLGFINLEHDVVPWPGAVQSLMACPRPWCFFGYLADIDFAANCAAPFGLVKFSSSFIASIPLVWERMLEQYQDCGSPWRMCDIHLGDYTRERGIFTPHQHVPAVLNANPGRVGRPIKDDVKPPQEAL